MQRQKTILLIDTNVLLAETNNIVKREKEYRIMLPRAVVEEMEFFWQQIQKHRSNKDDTKRYLVLHSYPIVERKIKSGDWEIVTSRHSGIVGHLLNKYPWLKNLGLNDVRILAAAIHMTEQGQKVILVTRDGVRKEKRKKKRRREGSNARKRNLRMRRRQKRTKGLSQAAKFFTIKCISSLKKLKPMAGNQ